MRDCVPFCATLYELQMSPELFVPAFMDTSCLFNAFESLDIGQGLMYHRTYHLLPTFNLVPSTLIAFRCRVVEAARVITPT